jgi:hypothetical protein
MGGVLITAGFAEALDGLLGFEVWGRLGLAANFGF